MDTLFPNLTGEESTQPSTLVDALASASGVSTDFGSDAHRAKSGLAPAGATDASSPQQRLRDSLALAMELAPQVIDNLTLRALHALDWQSSAQHDPAQRHLLDTAAVMMDGHRPRWSREFATYLQAACAQSQATEQATPLPVADTRICALELAELDALMLALGSARGNPLGPQTYVRAITELIAQSEGSAEHRQIWSACLLGALSTQLVWVYLQLNACLKGTGHTEASALAHVASFNAYADGVFGFAPSASPQSALALGAHGEQLPPDLRELAADARKTVRRLRKVLGFSVADLDQQAASAAEQVLQMMRDIDESERLMVMIQERGLTVPEEDSAEVAQGKRQDQVDQLLGEYCNGSNAALQRLAQPVRDAMARLRAPLERLAQRDGDMFTQAGHPARVLLQAITQQGLQVGDDLPEVLKLFVLSLDKLIDDLALIEQPSAKSFEQALSEVKPAWMHLNAMRERAELRKERSISQLAARKQLASRLAFELVGRQDASDAPVAIKQFLMNQWSMVLAQAQLHPKYSRDQRHYEYLANLLLWSVSPRRAGLHPARLRELLPNLVEGMRVGLAGIECPQATIDSFLRDLNKLHEGVLATKAVGKISADSYPPEPPNWTN